MNIHSHTPLSPQSPIQVSGFIIYTLAYNHLHPPALFKPVTSKIATQSWPRLHSTAPLWKYISTIKKVRVNTVKFFFIAKYSTNLTVYPREKGTGEAC